MSGITVNNMKDAFAIVKILINNGYFVHMRTAQKYHKQPDGTFYTLYTIEFEGTGLL